MIFSSFSSMFGTRNKDKDDISEIAPLIMPGSEFFCTPKAIQDSLKYGKMMVRPAHGGDIWGERDFMLTKTNQLISYQNTKQHSSYHRTCMSYNIQRNSLVYETNLGAHAFELVTSGKILHLKTESKDCTLQWMAKLKEVIQTAPPENIEPLLTVAFKKSKTDIYYSLTIQDERSLAGVVLERVGEWAVVKQSKAELTGVFVGSTLVSVNDKDITQLNYSDTICALRNWAPPLCLQFRRTKRRVGYLLKQTKFTDSSITSNWTRRYFILDEGSLMYKVNDSEDTLLTWRMPLMGSSVCYIDKKETGRHFCLKIVSGVKKLIIAASSAEEQLDWYASLYHAIALANGGGYLHYYTPYYRRRLALFLSTTAIDRKNDNRTILRQLYLNQHDIWRRTISFL